MPTPTKFLQNLEEVLVEERVAIDAARHSVDVQATEPLFGLSLSGGGIRSATFCLGVLQAFAKHDKLLPRFDYMSTVSGGGYIGAWLSAWVRTKGSISAVCDELARGRADGFGEASEVSWLRQYSNYLAPRLAGLSADTMTLVATWLRNVFLNLIILVSFIALCLLIPRLLHAPAMFAIRELNEPVGYAATWLGFFLFPLANSFHLSETMTLGTGRRIALLNNTAGVMLLVVVPGLLTAVLGSLAIFPGASTIGPSGQQAIKDTGILAGFMLGLAGSIWLAYQVAEQRRSKLSIAIDAGIFVGAYAVSLAVGLAAIYFARPFIQPLGTSPEEQAANALTFGPPTLLLAFGLVGSIIVGLVGRVYHERTREWWARMNGWFILLGFAWLATFCLAFYSLPAMRWAWSVLGPWIATAGIAWLGSLVAVLKSAMPNRADRSARSALQRPLINLAMLLVVCGFLVAVAACLGLAIEGVASKNAPLQGSPAPLATVALRRPAGLGASPGVVLKVDARGGSVDGIRLLQPSESEGPNLTSFVDGTFATLRARQNGLLDDVGLLVALLITFIVFGWRVDVNKFSLHNMYKTRLIRCYLGACRQGTRKPHPFMGFDDQDDFALADLAKRDGPDLTATRPFHLINAALNITHGSNLAWRERQAASFTLSPLHAGFTMGASTGDALAAQMLSAGLDKVGGYRTMVNWASEKDDTRKFTLGVAMAVSGAAASALSGRSTSATGAFLKTIFNARLGRWVPNPLWRTGWYRSGPTWGLLRLMQELFGHVNETSDFVYLSDGGHFDNTGVYELVRRRCRLIVVVDATADPAGDLSDLANMVRKCRIDFRVDIQFPWRDLLPKTPVSAGYAFGEIHYPELDRPGTLIVIKPTKVNPRDNNPDLYSYAKDNPDFPHQTTADQFFSESQFESYRRLGEVIAARCIRDKRFAKLWAAK